MNNKNLKLPIVIKQDDNDTLMAYCPIFKWCHTFAENKKELSSNLEEVIWMYFDIYKDWEKDIFEWDNIFYI